MKRVTAFLMAFVAVFYLAVDCTPRAKAVVPLAFIEAALASYVASTGYKLWVDNGTGQDLLSLVGDLYDEWIGSISGDTPMTLEEFAAGYNYVYPDDSGNIILSHDTCQTFQSFSDWIYQHYSVTLDNQKVTVIPSYVADLIYPSITFTGDVTVEDILPADQAFNHVVHSYGGKMDWSPRAANIEAFLEAHRNHVIMFIVRTYVGSGPAYNFTVLRMYAYPNISSSYTAGRSYYADIRSYNGNYYTDNQTAVLDGGMSSYDGNNVIYYGEGSTASTPFSDYYFINVNGTVVNQPGLMVSLANSVLDKVSNMTADQSMVLDVGASAGASEEDIADAVVSGYQAGLGSVAVTDTVVSTEVIDTPVQAYPDFDSLGLPELGLALVERFPFCIPYDFVHLVQLFDAEPVPPYIVIDIFPSSFKQRVGITGTTSFTLDMSRQEYATLGAIMRWGSLVGFCILLLIITKRLIWTS